MAKEKRILYQFPVSHYCEKTRWNLDAKGLSYETRDVVPGVHLLILKRRSGVRTVPMLVDRGVAIGDSTSIALHLEDAYPSRPMVPLAGDARSRALTLEDYFDRIAGTAVRSWIYGQLMQAERGLAAAVLLDAYALPVRLLGTLVAPYLEGSLRKMYRINADGMAKAHAAMLAAADRLEAETQGDPSRYLVEGALSIADITAASMLAPIVAPPGSPYVGGRAKIPEPLEQLRATLRERPAGKWVTERYRRDRGSVVEGSAFRAL